MIKLCKLSNKDRVSLHLNMLDELKKSATGYEDATATELHELNTRFNLARHGLEMEIRGLMSELEAMVQENEGLRNINKELVG